MILDLGSGIGIVGIGMLLSLPHYVEIVVTDFTGCNYYKIIYTNKSSSSKTSTNNNSTISSLIEEKKELI